MCSRGWCLPPLALGLFFSLDVVISRTRNSYSRAAGRQECRRKNVGATTLTHPSVHPYAAVCVQRAWRGWNVARRKKKRLANEPLEKITLACSCPPSRKKYINRVFVVELKFDESLLRLQCRYFECTLFRSGIFIRTGIMAEVWLHFFFLAFVNRRDTNFTNLTSLKRMLKKWLVNGNTIIWAVHFQK